MSTPAQMAANLANAQHSTGPRTEAGKAASAKNATKSRLFSTHDFIRPGEESLYAELNESVRLSLAPIGDLECTLVDEIRRAMWRLRRCGETEAAMVDMCVDMCAGTGANMSAGTSTAAHEGKNFPIPDPLQIEATAKLQFSVDRARSQCHRLLHKCTAELRKLQTERQFRLECFDEKTDLSFMGVAELRVVRKSLDESTTGTLRLTKLEQIRKDGIFMAAYRKASAIPADLIPHLTLATPATKQTREPAATSPTISRNARCACGSGLKFKRCCALKTAA